MSNLNTIENVIPLVDSILDNISVYVGYNIKYGYFDSAKVDDEKLFTLYDHNGDWITGWDLNDETDRSDLMTRHFVWYDIVPSENVSKPNFKELY